MLRHFRHFTTLRLYPESGILDTFIISLPGYMTITHQEDSGVIASLNNDDNPHTFTVDRAGGITPTGGTIPFKKDFTTRIKKGENQSISFSNLTIGALLHVEGVFDTPSQTQTARNIHTP
jgi:hypothetical protein